MVDGRALRTGIGTSTADTIMLLGHDLARDLIGQVSFGELAFWLLTKRRPTPPESAMFGAVLVSLADHGFTPTAIAARLDLHQRPGGVAGRRRRRAARRRIEVPRGDRGCSPLPVRRARGESPRPEDEAGWDQLAVAVTAATTAAGRFVRLGHPVHKVEDRRAGALRLARRHDRFGTTQLFAAIGRVHPEILGRTLPLNGAGACGAVLADLGLPVSRVRGVALLARCAGILGHLAEEQADPVGMDIYLSVDRNVDYRP